MYHNKQWQLDDINKHCLISAVKTQQNKRQKGAIPASFGEGGQRGRAILFPTKPSSLHLMQLGEIKPYAC